MRTLLLLCPPLALLAQRNLSFESPTAASVPPGWTYWYSNNTAFGVGLVSQNCAEASYCVLQPHQQAKAITAATK